MQSRRRLVLLVTAAIAAGPSAALASDPGSLSEWIAVLYLVIAGPFTVASIFGMIAGGSFGWYEDKDSAVAHASVATLVYICGIPLAFLASKSALGTALALVILGLLIWLSIKVPLKLHELQKPHVREKLFKEYLP